MKQLRKKIIFSLAASLLSISFYAHAVEDTFLVTQVVTDAPSSSTPSTSSGSSSGGGGGSGAQINLKIIRLLVDPSFTSARITLETNLLVLESLHWGLTPSYELGVLEGTAYQRVNEMNLNGLNPNTKYYFKMELTDEYGRHHTIANQEFTTLFQFSIPENILNLAATPNEKTITLTWKNPVADFGSIRILKSDKFYPRDPFEGEVVYEGTGEKFVDTDVLLGTRYYYTAFVKDKYGNLSSGAFADAALLRSGEKLTPSDFFGGILLLPKDQIHPLISELSLEDVDFIQEGRKLPMIDGKVDIRGDLSLKISIDYKKVPEILKTIAITLYDPSDKEKSFSFLLRTNKDKTTYEAIVAPLERPGKYSFGIAILDHKNQGLKKMAGVLAATVPDIFFGRDGDFGDLMSTSSFLLIVLLLVLIVLIFILSRRRRNRDFEIPYQAFQPRK